MSSAILREFSVRLAGLPGKGQIYRTASATLAPRFHLIYRAIRPIMAT